MTDNGAGYKVHGNSKGGTSSPVNIEETNSYLTCAAYHHTIAKFNDMMNNLCLLSFCAVEVRLSPVRKDAHGWHRSTVCCNITSGRPPRACCERQEGEMYCPSCGSNNQDGIKFCTRCGTNLSVVTNALTGKLSSSTIDERVMKLLKDYNKGRRDLITGAVIIPAGLLIWTALGLTALGFMPAFFIICWMFFWGIPSLAVGLSKMLAASSEMKVLGYDPKHGLLPVHIQGQPLPQSGIESDISTDPLDFPGSATEQTTRQLENKIHRPPVERSRQSQ